MPEWDEALRQSQYLGGPGVGVQDTTRDAVNSAIGYGPQPLDFNSVNSPGYGPQQQPPTVSALGNNIMSPEEIQARFPSYVPPITTTPQSNGFDDVYSRTQSSGSTMPNYVDLYNNRHAINAEALAKYGQYDIMKDPRIARMMALSMAGGGLENARRLDAGQAGTGYTSPGTGGDYQRPQSRTGFPEPNGPFMRPETPPPVFDQPLGRPSAPFVPPGSAQIDPLQSIQSDPAPISAPPFQAPQPGYTTHVNQPGKGGLPTNFSGQSLSNAMQSSLPQANSMGLYTQPPQYGQSQYGAPSAPYGQQGKGGASNLGQYSAPQATPAASPPGQGKGGAQPPPVQAGKGGGAPGSVGDTSVYGSPRYSDRQ